MDRDLNKNRKKIGIRVDGGVKIGMGHVMRTLSLAAEIISQNGRVIFYTRLEEIADFIRCRNFEARVLQNPKESYEEEVPELSQMVLEDQINLLLIDSYELTEGFILEMNKIVETANFDDTGELIFPTKYLINYNCYAQTLGIEERSLEGTALLLGADYVPVRKEFIGLNYQMRSQMKNILITAGGSDSFNISEQIYNALMAEPGNGLASCFFHIVCGKMNPNIERLKGLESKNQNLKIYVDVKNMAEIMENCDLAISAGGSTVYELCAVGLPAITFYYVENQRRISETFEKTAGMLNAGNYQDSPEKMLENLVKEACLLKQDYDKRKKLSEKMLSVVDGKGAYRLASALLEKSCWKSKMEE